MFARGETIKVIGQDNTIVDTLKELPVVSALENTHEKESYCY
jgi:hypothetical protein